MAGANPRIRLEGSNPAGDSPLSRVRNVLGTAQGLDSEDCMIVEPDQRVEEADCRGRAVWQRTAIVLGAASVLWLLAVLVQSVPEDPKRRED